MAATAQNKGVARPDALASERFPSGRFAQGDRVRLRRPGGHNLFDKPSSILQIVGVHWFRMYEPPIYDLREEGGTISVTPFRDTDLRRARPSTKATAGE